jgi:hypothetical protein
MPDEIEKGEETIGEDELLKSLDTLEALAKGKVAEEAPAAEEEPEIITKSDVDDEDGEERGQEENANEEEQEKSFAEKAVESSENLRKAIEVSDFLSDLVEEVGKAIDGLKSEVRGRLDGIEKSLADAGNLRAQVTEAFSMSMKGLLDLVKSSSVNLEDLKKSIDELGSQPVHGRKSKLTVLEKSFNANENENTLTKSQILSTLTEMVISGQEGVTANDIVRFESGGSLNPAVLQKVKTRLGV